MLFPPTVHPVKSPVSKPELTNRFRGTAAAPPALQMRMIASIDRIAVAFISLLL
jgi:hypothetical protein